MFTERWNSESSAEVRLVASNTAVQIAELAGLSKVCNGHVVAALMLQLPRTDLFRCLHVSAALDAQHHSLLLLHRHVSAMFRDAFPDNENKCGRAPLKYALCLTARAKQ